MLRSFKLIQISKSTLYFLLWKLSLMFFGLISTFLVGHYLTLSTQGYYYTFLSLAGLKVIVELGFASIITTFIAHEDLFYTNKNYVPTKSLQRVSLITKFALKWFAYAGIVLMFLLFIVGYIFFSIADENSNQVFWSAPWVFFVFCTSLNLFILPFWAVLEGIGEFDNVYYYRFIQVTISSAISCIALYNGAGLWALSFGSALELCCGVFVIYFKYLPIFKKLVYLKSNSSLFNWNNEIFPMQWRLSLSSIGGYLSFSSMVPIVFYFNGAIKAGQLGMTLVFMSAMNAFCSAWVIPKSPIFSKLIAQGKMIALKKSFISTMNELFFVSFLFAAGLFFSAYTLFKLNMQFSQRLISLEAITIFTVATFFLVLSAPMTFYLRAFKEEPLLKISIFSGCLLIFLSIISCLYFNLIYLSFFYFLVILIQTISIFIIWFKKFNSRHSVNFIQ